MPGTPCGANGCAGHIEDGFCDTCGRAAGPVASAPVTALSTSSRQVARTGGYSRTGRLTAARRPQAGPGSTMATPVTAATSGGTRSGRATRGSSTRRRALGGGLVQMPTAP